MARQVFFIGYMGAGKSTAASLLGAFAGVAVADMDAMISTRMGLSVRRIFESSGEAGFRKIENEIFAEVAGNPAFPIVACGGGLPCSPVNWDTMHSQRGFVIWLDPALETLFARLQADRSRPLLLDGDELKEQEAIRAHHAERSRCYQNCDERFSGDIDSDALQRWTNQLRST